jgi:hypothetical protein
MMKNGNTPPNATASHDRGCTVGTTPAELENIVAHMSRANETLDHSHVGSRQRRLDTKHEHGSSGPR